MAMASKEPFSDNYLLLKPGEASLVDLGRLLFSSKLGKRSFIECPEELEYAEFRRRWLIFVSVVAQKALAASGKTMKQIGYIVEMWLNLLSSNGGLIRLLFNNLKGEVVWPERTSATFTSAVGNLDRRVDLDKSIKHEDANYKTFLSMMATKLSYENAAFAQNTVKNHWNMDFLGFFSFWNDFEEVASTRAIVIQDTKSEPNLIVVAFKGTNPFDADQWRTDVDISWYELADVGKIHSGFMKALGLQKNRGWPKEIEEDGHQYAYYAIREMLREIFRKNEKAKFILTGHSLGGALAILFAAVLALHEDERLLDKLEGVYTFGQPRVGDQQFGDYMKDKVRKYYIRYMRFVYCNDMVPRIPYDDKTLLFKHFGPCLYYNSLYQGQILEEEPNKNYFNLFWAIPKILNAAWELIRGFFIGIIEGRKYKETWFMTTLRFVGLIIPGLSAHLPPDYVNLTLLGSLHAPPELGNLPDSKVD
ncbi:hypothetical protein L6164_024649 [Bauhinia variegata]|uniref:Uncharacterized protein n=1 Tax=Bauhinia variegata TaxID=167791 RepID=A0ACB9LXW9_BAUVA|nr:hypothetical protein L6164_024649 [Bauhinia variegata]